MNKLWGYKIGVYLRSKIGDLYWEYIIDKNI